MEKQAALALRLLCSYYGKQFNELFTNFSYPNLLTVDMVWVFNLRKKLFYSKFFIKIR